MAFNWLIDFQRNKGKKADYAQKTLAAYSLGMRAKGSIAGVSITADADGCEACKRLDKSALYHPDEAPHLPLPTCDRPETCSCVYRPVMTYQVTDDPDDQPSLSSDQD
jgi:hypothetical protein